MTADRPKVPNCLAGVANLWETIAGKPVAMIFFLALVVVMMTMMADRMKVLNGLAGVVHNWVDIVGKSVLLKPWMVKFSA